MGLKRRDFLERTGLALAALGAGELGLSLGSQRYRQALAEPASHKLALLVGIDQYRNFPLSGCVTDVELQRELLIHRFGFQPQNILTLTNQQATREAIEAAFMAHLVKQARLGSVVVFHFSGYGGQVMETSPTIQTSLVPVDDPISGSGIAGMHDLLESRLGQLVRSLPTDKSTLILDTSYTYPGKPLLGNLRIRSRPSVFPSPRPPIPPSPRPLTSPRPPFPGVVLAAAAPDQLATEAQWNGFSAGLFTYALTRYLWHSTPATTLHFSMRRAKEQVEQLASQTQQPQISGQKSQDLALRPYYLPPTTLAGAEGVVIAVDESSRMAQIWLAGLPIGLLEQYGSNSLMVLVNQAKAGEAIAPPVYLQLLSRDGLTATAKVYRAGSNPDATAPPPTVWMGQLVRERVRVLPRTMGLTVALDSSLERIERVDAISALTTVPHVSSAIAGEQTADYLFSKIQPPSPTQVAAVAPLSGVMANTTASQSSYGLFSLGEASIPNTVGEAGEAVKVAVRRLIPRFQALLAAKWLNLTVNEMSSQIAVRASLEIVDPQVQALLRRETPAIAQSSAKGEAIPPLTETDGLLRLPVGSRIQYRVENFSPHPLYLLLLGMNSEGSLMAFSDLGSGRLATGEVLISPQNTPAIAWVVQGAVGLAETYLIFSRAPFSQTQTLLEATLHPVGSAAATYHLPNPLEVAQAVLQDLHLASDTAAQVVGNPPDMFTLDVDVWASLRFDYQVVE